MLNLIDTDYIIDTDFKRNVSHVRPYLGVILIASVALMFGVIIYSAMQQFTQTVYSAAPSGTEGALSIRGGVGNIRYGDTVKYNSFITDVGKRDAVSYITTVCFQDDKLVYQRVVPQGVAVELSNQIGGVNEWDGEDASCSATLVYRQMSMNRVDVYVVESVSFDVKGRRY